MKLDAAAVEFASPVHDCRGMLGIYQRTGVWNGRSYYEKESSGEGLILWFSGTGTYCGGKEVVPMAHWAIAPGDRYDEIWAVAPEVSHAQLCPPSGGWGPPGSSKRWLATLDAVTAGSSSDGSSGPKQPASKPPPQLLGPKQPAAKPPPHVLGPKPPAAKPPPHVLGPKPPAAKPPASLLTSGSTAGSNLVAQLLQSSATAAAEADDDKGKGKGKDDDGWYVDHSGAASIMNPPQIQLL